MSTGTVLAVLLAPFVGSFLGVVTERLPGDRSILFARSACDHCGKKLTAADLVPLFSYAARCGRCRCGKAKLSAFYPTIELAAVGVALSAASLLSGWLLWASLGLGWTLLALAAIDYRHFILPDVLTLPLVPAGFAVAYGIDPDLLGEHMLGAVAGFVAFAAIAQAYRLIRGREGLGLGDAKLLAAAGAWLGWRALPSVVVVAATVALVVALARCLIGDKLSPTSPVAFGAFLALAFWLVWLLGPIVVG